jgi:hypothetical protein
MPGEHQALGWTVRHWGDLTVLGQDADTFGQRAVLRVIPERGVALCVLTNSPPGGALAQELLGCLAGDLLDVPPGADPADVPAAAAALDPGPELGDHPGVYERLHQRIVARIDGGGAGLVLATEPSGVLQALGVKGSELDLAPVTAEGTVFRLTDPATGTREHAVFVGPPEGPPAGLYLGGRLHRRTS